jgi:Fic family protein
MYTSINQFEPYPAQTNELEDIAREVVAVSSRLEGRLAPVVLTEIRKLLRVVNSYYSNLIEGHSTHPVDVERAMRDNYSVDQDKRDLQLESLIHIRVQEKISALLYQEPETNVVSSNFLCWLHREFYENMPERLRWVTDPNGKRAYVEAGQIRERTVAVGRHIPPLPESLGDFLARFEEVYHPDRWHGLRPVIGLAAAHHRLMWIHPFLDGNGRVGRLFTDAYFIRINLAGYGLWNVSRGLARRQDDYRDYLAAADFPREGDLDGRGNLSDRTLADFCRFFLETCLDQANFMDELLALNTFLDRLEKYVFFRNGGIIVDEKGERLSPLNPNIITLLKDVAIKGEISRGDAFRIIGMSERTGRNILKELLNEGLLVSSAEREPIRLGFPAAAAGYWFPNLYPNNIT